MMNSKKEFRKEMLRLRDSKSPESLSVLNKRILDKVISNIDYQMATNIFIFVSYKSEVDTHDIIRNALSQGKRVCVPKVISKEEGMKAIYINSLDELSPQAPFGILEPEIYDNNIANESDIDLVLVPGVAFDNNGGRMGYGGGFYDRFLPLIQRNCRKIGLCYSFQVVDSVIMEQNDESVSCIITD